MGVVAAAEGAAVAGTTVAAAGAGIVVVAVALGYGMYVLIKKFKNRKEVVGIAH